MKIPRANDKLKEARFFLEHLRQESRKATGYHPAAFRYYLSAFLSAARSVTFVLQVMAKDEYDAMFQEWLETLSTDESELLRFMNEQRVSEVHLRGAATVKKRKFIPAESVPGVIIIRPPSAPPFAHGTSKLEAGLPPSETGAWIGVPEYFFEIEGEHADVTAVCERYLTLLECFLRVFDEVWGSPSPP